VGTPGDDKLREVSRAFYLLGQSLRRVGREEDARKALVRSQQIREAKFKYDVKHIFDEKKGPEEGESRVSDRVADLLENGSPEGKQGAQAMIQQGLPGGPAAKQPASAKETEAARQYRAFVAEILGSSYNDLGVMRAKSSKFPEAAEFFRQASTWKPELLGLDRNWGLAAFRAELYAEAVLPLERQLRAHPEDSLSRQVLGLSYSMLENYPKAAEVFEPLLEHGVGHGPGANSSISGCCRYFPAAAGAKCRKSIGTPLAWQGLRATKGLSQRRQRNQHRFAA
jgi:hypothetical protein